MALRTIREILYGDGPQTIGQLSEKTGRSREEISAEVAEMAMKRQAHVELDLTIWYSEDPDG